MHFQHTRLPLVHGEVTEEQTSGDQTAFRAGATLEDCALRKEAVVRSSDLRSGELFSIFSRADYLHELFGMLPPESSVCSPPLIYLFNPVVISV